MRLSSLFTKFSLRYSDPRQEAEYLQIKMPFLKNLLKYLIICIIILLIPLIIHFFIVLQLQAQGYMAIILLSVALFLLFARNFLGKWLEYLVVAYLVCVVALVIFNLSHVLLSLTSCDAFYGGYAFALIHRILGYRVVNIHTMILFHIVSLSLRLVFLYDHNLFVTLIVVAVEIATLCLSIKSEMGERQQFDSLYKSKQQLLVFKEFLIRHLPNQMVIFAEESFCTYFANDSFRKTFGHKTISSAQLSLRRMTLVKESLERNSPWFSFFASLAGGSQQKINLYEIMSAFSKSKNFIKDSEIVSFQVYETESLQEVINNFDISAEGWAQNNIKKANIKDDRSVLLANTPEMNECSTFMRRKRRLYRVKLLESSKLEILGRVKSSQMKQENNPQPKGDSEKRTFKVKMFKLPWEGKDAVAVILDDITQQKTIMELEIASKNKDLVIAMVSHELRTPLNGMLGLIDIIKKMVSSTQVTSYLDACRNSGVFLLNLVNSILDMSQIKNNKLKLVYTKVDLSELLEEIKSLFESFCAAKNLYLKIDISQYVPQTIRTDRNRLSQILINLVGNAFKFTFEGGITVKIEPDKINSANLQFYIQDTGLGIKKEDQEKLFKLFGRLEQQDKNINTNGVGLGLNISNTLVMLLNPSESRGIQVNSEPGKGSTFSFLLEPQIKESFIHSKSRTIDNDLSSFDSIDEEILLPTSKILPYKTLGGFRSKEGSNLQKPQTIDNINQSSVDAILPCNNHLKIPFSLLPVTRQRSDLRDGLKQNIKVEKIQNNIIQLDNLQKPWCLIVDDNPFNIIVARYIMEERGYQIETALNGKEAIQKVIDYHIIGRRFEIILMDCQMPVMDGYEATRQLMEMMRMGQTSKCPIIALTANNRDEEHERLCGNVGISGSISKPLDVNELDRMIKNLKTK